MPDLLLRCVKWVFCNVSRSIHNVTIIITYEITIIPSMNNFKSVIMYGHDLRDNYMYMYLNVPHHMRH